MRRIYESDALDRSDDDPFRPNERTGKHTPRAARTVPAGVLSRTLIPKRLRNRAVSIDVSTPASVYRRDTPIPIAITMKNAMPFPIAIPTRSPLLWSWHVDGLREASHVPEEPPAEPGRLDFDRGERKAFGRRWEQVFRISDSEWIDADPGTYTISAAINVENPAEAGVYDETTVRIE